MPVLVEQSLQVQQFLEQGGYPLWAIMLLAMIICILFFERWLFLQYGFSKYILAWQRYWEAQEDKHSWSAQRIRDALIAQGNACLNRYKWFLKVAIAVCPLLGLMGTVSGMILVFDELAFFGNGNPRLMSAGIFKATIPTMAGMLVAIIGLLLQTVIKRMSRSQQQLLVQSLPLAPEQNAQQGASQ